MRLGHARNSGAVFGIMKGSGAYFTVFSIVAAAVIVAVLVLVKGMSRRVQLGLGFILGGAIGNLIDRLRFGAVVDFIDIGVGERLRWPSFNVADLAITVGVIIIIAKALRTPSPCPGADPSGKTSGGVL